MSGIKSTTAPEVRVLGGGGPAEVPERGQEPHGPPPPVLNQPDAPLDPSTLPGLDRNSARSGRSMVGIRLLQEAGSPVGGSRLFELDDVNVENVSRALRQRLEAIGYQGSEILIRAIARNRSIIERTLETGTDRSPSSSTYSGQSGYFKLNDADPAIRAAHGISPEQVTYCVRLRWNDQPPTVYWGGRQNNPAYPENRLSLAEWLNPIKPKLIYQGVRSIAVYFPERLELAPGAEAEYWFTKAKPAEALALVITPSRAHWLKVAGPEVTEQVFEGNADEQYRQTHGT